MKMAIILSSIGSILFIGGTFCRDELTIKEGVITLTRFEQWGRKSETCWQIKCSSVRDVSSWAFPATRRGGLNYRTILLLTDGNEKDLPSSFSVRSSLFSAWQAKLKSKIRSQGELRAIRNPGKPTIVMSMLFWFFALLYWVEWIRKRGRKPEG
jgi:hypothetical protein